MKRLPDIYLASQSPRRQALLQQIGVGFEVLAVDVDETPHAGEPAGSFVERVALDKARAGRTRLPAGRRLPVLGADTCVVANGKIMGKPQGREHALDMLQLLSGTTHEVLSAVVLAGDHEALRVNASRVTFRTLSAEECAAYWATGEPADKAGAYAIQGLAAIFVTHLAGSYSGVMGLPLSETAELLREFGIRPAWQIR
jgi:septum formation protein